MGKMVKNVGFVVDIEGLRGEVKMTFKGKEKIKNNVLIGLKVNINLKIKIS